MAKVTYLLGAGASCRCLPTYIDFTERFSMFRKFVGYGKGLRLEDRSDCETIYGLCNKLQDELIFHNTPDTVAKKYFHLELNEDLSKLKIILTLFFLYEQCMGFNLTERADNFSTRINVYNDKSPIEKRYDSFIASILDPVYAKLNLNTDFKILTWNYDLQFEISYQKYSLKEFGISNKAIQSVPFTGHNENEEIFDAKKFSIVHLNGIAYSERRKPDNKNFVPYGNFYDDEMTLLKEIVDHYNTMIKNPAKNTFINFAWERHSSYPYHADLKKTMESATSIANQTEILVVIGYSFPIFNREVDLILMQKMKNLKQIYVQSLNGAQLKKNLIDIFWQVNDKFNEESIDVITDTTSFYIPLEVNSKGSYSFR